MCGHTLSTESPASTGLAPASDAAGTVGLGRAQEPTKRSGEATGSLILGLFSFIPIVGLLAVIFGHMARASIRRSGGRLLGDGMAVFGLLLGYLGLGAWIIYGLTIIINPLLPSTRRRQNERLVVLSLRTINTAAVTYATTYNVGYPPSLAALGPPKTGNPNASTSEIVKAESAQAAGLIDEVLASGTVFGYRFTYAAGKAVGRPPVNVHDATGGPAPKKVHKVLLAFPEFLGDEEAIRQWRRNLESHTCLRVVETREEADFKLVFGDETHYTLTDKEGNILWNDRMGPGQEMGSSQYETLNREVGCSKISSGTEDRLQVAREKVDSSIWTYTVHADPVTPGVTGDNHYFTNESGIIRLGYDYKTGKVGEANADSPPISD
jgi:hypothetical protein